MTIVKKNQSHLNNSLSILGMLNLLDQIDILKLKTIKLMNLTLIYCKNFINKIVELL